MMCNGLSLILLQIMKIPPAVPECPSCSRVPPQTPRALRLRSCCRHNPSWDVKMLLCQGFEVVTDQIRALDRCMAGWNCTPLIHSVGMYRYRSVYLPWWTFVGVLDVRNLFLGEDLVVPVRGVVSLEGLGDELGFPVGKNSREDVCELEVTISPVFDHREGKSWKVSKGTMVNAVRCE